MESTTKTLGEQRVRTDFNVTGSDVVGHIKTKAAELINLIDGLTAKEGLSGEELGEYVRLKSLAMTDIENGAMWAVKAATA